jgi:hypothetical protein
MSNDSPSKKMKLTTSGATLKIVPQFSQLSVKNDLESMNVLLKATPRVAQSPCKTLELVLVLDVSASMGRLSEEGSPIRILKQAYDNIVANGIQGIDNLYLRVLGFGEKLVDFKIPGDTELTKLDENTKESFESIGRELDGCQYATNIQMAAEAGIDILSKHDAEKRAGKFGDQVFAPTQHVIVFTDGCANEGLRSGDALAVKNLVDIGIERVKTFVHYVGVGGALDAKFISGATNAGKSGVFAFAPSIGQIGEAFETVFGKITRARGAFDVAYSVKYTVPRTVVRLGLLEEEEEALIVIKPPMVETESVLEEAISVTLYATATSVISESHKLFYAEKRGDEDQEVRLEMDNAEALAKIQRLAFEAKSAKQASAKYDEFLDGPEYRSLTGKGACKFAKSRRIMRDSAKNRDVDAMGAKGAQLTACASQSQV